LSKFSNCWPVNNFDISLTCSDVIDQVIKQLFHRCFGNSQTVNRQCQRQCGLRQQFKTSPPPWANSLIVPKSHMLYRYGPRIGLKHEVKSTNNHLTDPLPTRSLGAVVAVTTCSPSAHHWKVVVSADCAWWINFFCFTSQNSMLPRRLPNPHNARSEYR